MNVKIRFHDKEMDINTSGPFVDARAKAELLQVFDQVREDDIVCISGSLQNDMKDTLEHITQKIYENKAKLILDIPNITAAELIACHPYLIKPNLEELAHLLQTEKELEKIIPKAKSVFADKEIRVLLSLGEDGSCYISRDAIYQVSSARVDKVVNTVAAGDSMLAGFLYMLAKDNTLEDTLSFASAAGSASVMSSYLPDMDTIQKLLPQINMHEL
ncbi:MAG: PfkB family carbohydrate kinase [[Clostridium] innocuum]